MGLGPGQEELLPPLAARAIAEADVVVGYRSYLAQASRLLKGKTVVSAGMTREVFRARTALRLAAEGRRVAVVSGGDPGVYGMAAAVFEVMAAEKIRDVQVVVVPGVTALVAAAALLGAPLGQDFACISLSDRLVSWEEIARRLEMAAKGGFVVGLYNPGSTRRRWQYPRACELLLRWRAADTPVGIVRAAFRRGQEIILTRLGEASRVEVDMECMVIVGNSQSFTFGPWLVTPRGYATRGRL